MGTIEEMIEEAKCKVEKAELTSKDKRTQIVSLAYWNLKYHNPALTVKDIEDALDILDREEEDE